MAASIDLPGKAPLPSSAVRDHQATEASPVPEARPPNAPSDRSRQTQANLPGPPSAPDERGDQHSSLSPPEAELACRRRLAALGVAFSGRPPERTEAGCIVTHPIVVTRIGKEIAISPAAELNCEMAETTARFLADVVSPAAEKAFGERLKAVGHASAYVCRPRNGTQKLSEHAFGNAIDIARFTLSSGRTIDVEPAPEPKEARFLNEVRKAACGPFKTVLGPGSDPDHALHFHFDLARRRNGGTFCQ